MPLTGMDCKLFACWKRCVDMRKRLIWLGVCEWYCQCIYSMRAWCVECHTKNSKNASLWLFDVKCKMICYFFLPKAVHLPLFYKYYKSTRNVRLHHYSFLHSKGTAKPTFVCGANMGMKWAEKWAQCRNFRLLHNGPMLFTRPISVPAAHICMWVWNGLKNGLCMGLSVGSMMAPC